TEGDPTLYSTAIPVWQLLQEIAPELVVEIVPGVTSVTAAAARVGWALARKEELLAVAPASYRQDELHGLMDRFDTLCLLKVSQALPQVLTTLASFGPAREAVYLENLATPQEWITHDLAAAAGRGAYFALILVRRTERGAIALGPAVQKAPGKVWVVGLGP